MTRMMVLSQGYALFFFIFRCEEALPRDGLPGMAVPAELGRCVITWKGVTGFSRETV